jgi:hypothetical protein
MANAYFINISQKAKHLNITIEVTPSSSAKENTIKLETIKDMEIL